MFFSKNYFILKKINSSLKEKFNPKISRKSREQRKFSAWCSFRFFKNKFLPGYTTIAPNPCLLLFKGYRDNQSRVKDESSEKVLLLISKKKKFIRVKNIKI